MDLSPRVESDFFFATDDPQLRTSAQIQELFPSSPQVLITAAAAPGSGAEALLAPDYVARIRELSGRLKDVPGVESVVSLTAGPSSPRAALDGPLWRELLVAPSVPASNLVLQVDDSDTALLVSGIEAVTDELGEPGFTLRISGVPYVVEQIRRQLGHDLRLFSVAALVLFGFAVALLFRSWRVVLGTLVSCLAACVLTLAALRLAHVAIGPLTANIATVVFVLTLSHIVFLTAAWRRAGGAPAAAGDTVSGALAETLPASFWCMLTTLLGFLSLLLADARPMRELGVAGAIGALGALVVAFVVYPSFLRGAPPPPVSARQPTPGTDLAARPLGPAVAAVGLLVLLAAGGLGRLNTDPSLLTYFAAGSELRNGLAAVDHAGGSSPLSLVVRDPQGRRLDDPAVFPHLEQLQLALAADPAVGTTLGLPLVVAQGRQAPLMGMLALPQMIALMSTPAFDGIARSFLTEDGLSSLFFLRMREAERGEGREQVVARLEALVRGAGLEPELVGGLYDLQGRLARLVARSLLTGLGALMVLFVGVAAVVSRRLRTTAAMVGCLGAVVVLTLGSLGHLGLPLDIIASPAANVAIALGIDSMIHLVACVRRQQGQGWEAWVAARRTMGAPILGATLILAAGFGIFALSSFPPTRHFGIAVVIGTAAAALLGLVVLPYLARRRG